MSSIRFSMQIEEQLEKDYKEAIQSKYSDDDVDSAIKKAIDTFQIDLKCCRFNNSQIGHIQGIIIQQEVFLNRAAQKEIVILRQEHQSVISTISTRKQAIEFLVL